MCEPTRLPGGNAAPRSVELLRPGVLMSMLSTASDSSALSLGQYFSDEAHGQAQRCQHKLRHWFDLIVATRHPAVWRSIYFKPLHVILTQAELR